MRTLKPEDVGKFVVLWRHNGKQPAKVLEVKHPHIQYEIVDGPEKGEKFNNVFDFTQDINIFDTAESALAACGT